MIPRRFYSHAALLIFVTGVIAVELVSAAPGRQRGYAASYSPGVMARVSRARGLPVVGCMIATPGRDAIGRWLTVTSKRGRLRCRVTDTCHPRDCARIKARRIIVELDFASNRALCPRNEPPRSCPVEVWR